MKRLLVFTLMIAIALGAAMPLFASGEQEAAGGESGDDVKIGFLVKQPEETWFQDEWKFAAEAAEDYGFELVTLGAEDGEITLNAIDNLAAQGADGFIICTPDVRLGPAIVARAEQHGMKVMSVDDRFVGADGEFMEEVPHMGISAYEIGQIVGEALYEEMQNRDWAVENTGALAISFNELDTARERVEGATDKLVELGFPADRIFDTPQDREDVEGGFNAAADKITQHPDIEHWLVFALNDESVMGGVRAAEGRGFTHEDIIGVGIGGSGSALSEFDKDEMTGFFATVTISPYRHGYETAENMYKWIAEGEEPEKLIYTAGMLMTRDNRAEVLSAMGLDR
jgi:L-arabinose transport system substrate-binding protein